MSFVGPLTSQKKGGKGREGKGGSAGLCLPQPFWCVEPRQNSNGKSIRRQGEASVRRGACVQAGGELQRLISKRAPGLQAAAELSAGGSGAPEVPGKGGSLGRMQEVSRRSLCSILRGEALSPRRCARLSNPQHPPSTSQTPLIQDSPHRKGFSLCLCD